MLWAGDRWVPTAVAWAYAWAVGCCGAGKSRTVKLCRNGQEAACAAAVSNVPIPTAFLYLLMFSVWGVFNLLASCCLCWMHQGGILSSFQVKFMCLWTSMGDSWMCECLLLLGGHRCPAKVGSGSHGGNCTGWGAETAAAQMVLCVPLPKGGWFPPGVLCSGRTSDLAPGCSAADGAILPKARLWDPSCSGAPGTASAQSAQVRAAWGFHLPMGWWGWEWGAWLQGGQAEQGIYTAVTSFLCSTHQHRQLLWFIALWTSHNTQTLQYSSRGTLAFFLRSS